MTTISSKIDFTFDQNNGVMVLRPNLYGRFASLVEERVDGRFPRGWVFSNPDIFRGEVNQCDLRTFHGDFQEWYRLKVWMSTQKIILAHHFQNVPCSNGKHNLVKGGWDGHPAVCDFEDYELETLLTTNPRMAIEATLTALNDAQMKSLRNAS